MHMCVSGEFAGLTWQQIGSQMIHDLQTADYMHDNDILLHMTQV